MRFFPPPHTFLDDHGAPLASQDRRYFTRLSAAESSENPWRKEYIQRTRLLRSLGKGKVQLPSTAGKSAHGGLMVTYQPRTGQLSVSHVAASFTSSGVRAVHASLESQMVTASDPTTGKFEKRPVPRDPLLRFTPITPDLRQVRNDHPDYEVAVDMNVNRVMDISEELGWIMGENCPDGRCFVHPYSSPYITEGDVLYIRPGTDTSADKYGTKPLVTCVWIAKRRTGGVRDTTGAAVIVGNSRGFVRMFSITHSKGQQNDLREVGTFCVSPGVPIVQIEVDEDFLPKRIRQRRPWISVINATGEIYYLRNMPGDMDGGAWKMIPQTARIHSPLYNEIFPELEGLTQKQLKEKETHRTALLLKMDYSRIKDLWEHCRMDWFLKVDWAGGNMVSSRAGSESYWYGTVVRKADAPLNRYHLRKTKSSESANFVINGTTTDGPTKPSLFGSSSDTESTTTPPDELSTDPPAPDHDEWLPTTLHLNRSFTRITAYSLDNSLLARQGGDATSNHSIPGGNGCLLALGTNTGTIIVFNIRPPSTPAPTDHPIRTIHTDSPQITTLAVSSLAVFHGGNDGLVQAWDPLGSSSTPIRTLHSRFSARARRRIEQSTALQGDNQFSARCLQIDPDPTNLRGLVALGTFIRYWSFSGTEAAGRRGKRGHATGGGAKRASAARTKGAIRGVMRSDEIAMWGELEEQSRVADALERRFGVGRGAAAMSEEDMLAYASMISQEAFATERGASPEEDEELQSALRESLRGEEEEEEGAYRFSEPQYEAWSSTPGSLSPAKSPRKRGGWEKMPLFDDSWGQEDGLDEVVDQGFEDDLEMAIRLSLEEEERKKGKGKGREM